MKDECLLSSEVIVKSIEGDGNCLFRSVGSQLYGGSGFHDIIRSACMDYVELNKESFSGFVHEYPSVEKYIQEKRKLGVWGDNIEVQALSDLYRIPIFVYEKVSKSKLSANFLERHNLYRFSGVVSDNIFNNNEEFVYKLLFKIEPKTSKVLDRIKNNYSNNRPIRLLYENDLHYDSLFYRREHQIPIINMNAGLIEAKSIKSLKDLITLKRNDTKSKNPLGESFNLKKGRISNSNTALNMLQRKKAIKKFPIHFESSSESDNYITKSALFTAIKNKYRDEPDSIFERSRQDKIPEKEAYFEKPPFNSKQLFNNKFISGPKLITKKPAVKPAYFSRINSLNNTHLGVVERYARDAQLSSHQKELKKLLENDSKLSSSFPAPRKKCVAIYCPTQNLKQNTFRN